MKCASRLTLMKTAQEIRLNNLLLLIDEAGSAASLSRLTQVPPPYISQLTKGVKNESGRPRSIGDDTARKLERGMQKAEGWLDTDHSKSMLFSELNALEAQLVTLFRKLTDDDRDEILRVTNNLFSERFSEKTSAGNPWAKAPAPGGAGSYKKTTPIPGAPEPVKHKKVK